MRIHAMLLVFGLCAFLASSVNAKDALSANAIHQQIVALYSFHPHDLNKQQIADKSTALDEFWGSAKANPAAYLPVLRHDLQDAQSPSFFMYDGSKLLLSLSDTPEDRHVAMEAVVHCDLKDLQLTDYLYAVHRVAIHDEDTVDAAFHILGTPDFKAFIPQHALTLGQDYALIYMLMPEDPKYWESRAISRLASETDVTAQKSLLLLLWYAQTSSADDAVARFASDRGKPDISRVYASSLLDREKHPGVVAAVKARLTSETDLRVARRTTLQHISDEALDEFEMQTLEIEALR